MSQSSAPSVSFAQALTDAKSLIVQQSNRIKSDAEKLRRQSQEIAEFKASCDSMSREIERLQGIEGQYNSAVSAKDQAESMVGRQQVEINSLESAAREMQRVLGEQAERIADLSRELEILREQLPTDADEAALAAMASLLQSTRKGRSAASSAPAAESSVPSGSSSVSSLSIASDSDDSDTSMGHPGVYVMHQAA